MAEFDTRRLHEGMRVYSDTGTKMGKVAGAQGAHFRIKRGWILKDEILADTADIVDVRKDRVIVHMRGTIPGEHAGGRNEGSRGKAVAERQGDTRLL